MRKATKFFHTLGSIAMMGALLAIWLTWKAVPDKSDAVLLSQYYLQAELVSRWMLLPGMITMIVSGLISMIVGPGFYNAGWAWAKMAMGLSVFEGTLLTLQGPAQQAGDLARAFLMDPETADALRGVGGPNEMAAMIIFGVCAVATGCGIWRPRFGPPPKPSASGTS